MTVLEYAGENNKRVLIASRYTPNHRGHSVSLVHFLTHADPFLHVTSRRVVDVDYDLPLVLRDLPSPRLFSACFSAPRSHSLSVGAPSHLSTNTSTTFRE